MPTNKLILLLRQPNGFIALPSISPAVAVRDYPKEAAELYLALRKELAKSGEFQGRFPLTVNQQ